LTQVNSRAIRPSLSRSPFRYSSCADCPIGRAAGVDEGQACPFVARRHAPRRTLYLEGDSAGSVWFVRSGAVVLYRSIGDSDAVQAVRWPGSLVGLEALARPTYLDSARLAGAATLCGASRDVVATWLGPETPARALLVHVLGQLAGDGPRPTGSARSRIARWLLADADPSCHVPRQTVARLLDLAPETLSRVLGELAAAGAIEVTRRSVAVRQPGELLRLADLG
jgi:CRP-like cAMP-binding protein